MSDPESTDSDERIRYKTESVQKKSKKNVTSIIKGKNRNTNMGRNEKRHSRSSSPKRKSHKKNKRKIRSSSTSSSHHSVETKFNKNEPKQDDLISFQKIKSHVQNKAKPSLNKQKHIFQNEEIVPVLPVCLLEQNNKNSDYHRITANYNIELGNIIKDSASLQLPLCSSVGPKLPSYVPTDTKLGHSLPISMGEKNFVEQSQHRLHDTYTITYLLNSDKHSEQGLKAMLQSQTFPSSGSSDRIIGPSLPPYLGKKIIENYADKTIGPSLPSHLQIEDPSESNLQTRADFNSLLSTRVEEHQAIDQIRFGPSLPGHLRKQLQEETKESPKMFVESDEEDVYGPLPIGISNSSSSHKALEERALQLKIDQLKPNQNNEPERESWMIELPTAKAANFGLGPRQFRNRAGPDLSDRSSWTDLPGDKNKKKGENVPVDLKMEAQLKELIKRDKEQELLTRKHKRKEKTLLKIHEEQLAKEKKEKKSSERRPFSRDIDLQVNRFDDAQKQAIMKKAELLDDRFSSGKSKYL